jgi:hypothetical protein
MKEKFAAIELQRRIAVCSLRSIVNLFASFSSLLSYFLCFQFLFLLVQIFISLLSIFISLLPILAFQFLLSFVFSLYFGCVLNR